MCAVWICVSISTELAFLPHASGRDNINGKGKPSTGTAQHRHTFESGLLQESAG